MACKNCILMDGTHTHTHTEWIPEEPIVLHHFGQRAQNFENPTLKVLKFLFKCSIQF